MCQVFSNDKKSQGKVCSLVKESASRKFDMKEEVSPTTTIPVQCFLQYVSWMLFGSSIVKPYYIP